MNQRPVSAVLKTCGGMSKRGFQRLPPAQYRIEETQRRAPRREACRRSGGCGLTLRHVRPIGKNKTKQKARTMEKPMGTRPAHVKAPAYLTSSPPVPAPEPAREGAQPAHSPEREDPTRYGDWTKKGIAVDF